MDRKTAIIEYKKLEDLEMCTDEEIEGLYGFNMWHLSNELSHLFELIAKEILRLFRIPVK